MDLNLKVCALENVVLQVSTYVLCFQHVFTIGIILSATERHIVLPERKRSVKLCKRENNIFTACLQD